MEHRPCNVWVNYLKPLLAMILAKGKEKNGNNVIGNKASGLVWLEEKNISTPTFIVIKLNDYILNYEDILKSLIKEFKKDKKGELSQIFNNLKWNVPAVGEDFSKLKSFHGKSVCFRTSSSLEDLGDHSFAGLYETFLSITFTEKNFQKYLGECFYSIFSERVSLYINSNKLSPEVMDFSVIVQEMYQAKSSGVAFSNKKGVMKIVFGEGFGKNIVDGNNAYEITMESIEDIEQISEIKKLGLEKPFKKLFTILQKITFLKEKGQDVEWSISGNNVAILQTRDITRETESDVGEEIFDCTNISESYPNAISPLTYSFIQFAYSKVYANFFRLVGVSDSKIKAKTETLNNLLGYINGHVYYKITNWYRMIEILPGYSYNKEFFESMLVPQKKAPSVKKGGDGKGRSLLNLLRNLPVLLKFSYKLVFYKKINESFLDSFEKKYKKHKNTNLDAMTASELCTYYTNLKSDFLGDWKIPILNDFRLMIFHGILKKIVFSSVNDNSQLYLNNILANFSSGNDLELITELSKLSKYISDDKHLNSLFEKSDPKLIYAELLTSDEKSIVLFKRNFDNYIKKFGDRRPDELILESPRISDHPEMLISLIKSYLKVNIPNNAKKGDDKKAIRKFTMLIRNKNGAFVGFFYSRFAKWIANYTKLSIKFRELFRIKRAIVYGVARDCFLALADKFVIAGIIEEEEDIFFLTTNEIIAISNTNSFESDFKELIVQRKDCFAKYKEGEKIPERLKIIGIGKIAQLVDDTEMLSIKKELAGLPTSQGIIKGEVVVLEKFDANIDVQGKIVVTYQTDPGWSLIFPLIKGIILEKGNSLSHAAILSRELGIPSVVKVEKIVSKLKTGDIVEVDGNQGIIKILNK